MRERDLHARWRATAPTGLTGRMVGVDCMTEPLSGMALPGWASYAPVIAAIQGSGRQMDGRRQSGVSFPRRTITAVCGLLLTMNAAAAGGLGSPSGLGGWINPSVGLMALLLGSLFWSARMHDGRAGRWLYTGVLGGSGLLLLLVPDWMFARVIGLLLLAQVGIFLCLARRYSVRGQVFFL